MRPVRTGLTIAHTLVYHSIAYIYLNKGHNRSEHTTSYSRLCFFPRFPFLVCCSYAVALFAVWVR
jgi:hypothetical protein